MWLRRPAARRRSRLCPRDWNRRSRSAASAVGGCCPGTPPSRPNPAEGATIGILYVPRFGAGYTRPIVQGTTPAVLDTLGIGHYQGTAMPGAAGNFAVAGHRQTHGAVLDDIDALVPGDRIYVQTREGYYVYVFRNSQISPPLADRCAVAGADAAGRRAHGELPDHDQLQPAVWLRGTLYGLRPAGAVAVPFGWTAGRNFPQAARAAGEG